MCVSVTSGPIRRAILFYLSAKKYIGFFFQAQAHKNLQPPSCRLNLEKVPFGYHPSVYWTRNKIDWESRPEIFECCQTTISASKIRISKHFVGCAHNNRNSTEKVSCIIINAIKMRNIFSVFSNWSLDNTICSSSH